MVCISDEGNNVPLKKQKIAAQDASKHTSKYALFAFHSLCDCMFQEAYFTKFLESQVSIPSKKKFALNKKDSKFSSRKGFKKQKPGFKGKQLKSGYKGKEHAAPKKLPKETAQSRKQRKIKR